MLETICHLSDVTSFNSLYLFGNTSLIENPSWEAE